MVLPIFAQLFEQIGKESQEAQRQAALQPPTVVVQTHRKPSAGLYAVYGILALGVFGVLTALVLFGKEHGNER